MPSNTVLIRKLQRALNTKGGMKIMYSTSQFYSQQQDRPVTMYCIKQAVWDEERGRWKNVKLYETTSQMRIVKYLRDLWYTVIGKEIPQDEVWDAIKAKDKGEFKEWEQ